VNTWNRWWKKKGYPKFNLKDMNKPTFNTYSRLFLTSQEVERQRLLRKPETISK